MRDGLCPGCGRVDGRRGYTRRVPWLDGLRHRQHDKRVDKAARLAAAIALVLRRTSGRVMGRVILAQILRRAARGDKGEIGRIKRAGI